MLWIKRNLDLAVSGLVALVLLGLGGWILYSGIQKNTELEQKVDATQGILNNIYNSQEPFPSSNNIEIAKKEAAKLREAAAKSKKYFAHVPFEKVSGLAFRTFRDNTIDELRKKAASSQTELPNRIYAFSFTAQKDRTDFSPSTFPVIPEQMAEVKAVCTLLFDARVGRLGNLRRARVSDEDFRSDGPDYNALAIETNTLARAVSSPYEVTFHCYSSELAQVMSTLNKSPFGLVLKALQVEPEDGVRTEIPGGAPPPEAAPGPVRPRGPGVAPRRGLGVPGAPGVPVRPVAAAAANSRRPASNRPTILLDEKRFKVTVLLYVVKPLR